MDFLTAFKKAKNEGMKIRRVKDKGFSDGWNGNFYFYFNGIFYKFDCYDKEFIRFKIESHNMDILFEEWEEVLILCKRNKQIMQKAIYENCDRDCKNCCVKEECKGRIYKDMESLRECYKEDYFKEWQDKEIINAYKLLNL